MAGLQKKMAVSIRRSGTAPPTSLRDMAPLRPAAGAGQMPQRDFATHPVWVMLPRFTVTPVREFHSRV